MTFEEILDQAVAMLQRRGRMTYRTLQRQFALDEDALTDLKDELLYTHPEIRDDAGRGLIWTGNPSNAPPATSPPASSQDRAPLSYTPSYLAEKILTSRSALEGERKQVTVLFADLKGSTELIEGLDPEEARPAPRPGAARHDGRRASLRRHRQPGARRWYYGAVCRFSALPSRRGEGGSCPRWRGT
jgi:hypothetical protein